MKVYVVRHGETEYNKQNRMQGRTDAPLNEDGIAQAETVKAKLEGIHFDAVYTSSLDRAIKTAGIISGFSRDKIQIDDRLIEVCFGKYELVKYALIGPRLTLHWLYPETFPSPPGVEKQAEVRARAESFVNELKTKDYNSVLICTHGDFMRTFLHVIGNNKKKISWRDFVENCEVREFDI